MGPVKVNETTVCFLFDIIVYCFYHSKTVYHVECRNLINYHVVLVCSSA